MLSGCRAWSFPGKGHIGNTPRYKYFWKKLSPPAASISSLPGVHPKAGLFSVRKAVVFNGLVAWVNSSRIPSACFRRSIRL